MKDQTVNTATNLAEHYGHMEYEHDGQYAHVAFSHEGKVRRNAFRASMATFMATVCLGAGGLVYNALTDDDSGRVTSYAPKQHKTPVIDGDFRAFMWNVHGEMRKKGNDIHEADKTLDADVMFFTEASHGDAKWLREEFPDKYVYFVKSTNDHKSNEGGFGNVLMTSQEPKDIDSLSMPGNSAESKAISTLWGFGNDVVRRDTSFRRAADGTQESRSAISAILEVRDKQGDLRDVRFIGTHINGDPIIGPKTHDSQFNRLKDWTIDGEEDEQATVLCMDSNQSLERTTFEFAEEGYITPPIEKTTVPKNKSDKGKALDQCVYKPQDILRLSRMQVLKQFASDHFGVLFSRLPK